MANNKWMDDPVLSGISNEKLEILTKILDSSNGLEPKQMLAHFIQESNNASKNGINFTDAETNAILNVLKADMSPEDIKKIDMIRKMVNIISKRKGRI